MRILWVLVLIFILSGCVSTEKYVEGCQHSFRVGYQKGLWDSQEFWDNDNEGGEDE